MNYEQFGDGNDLVVQATGLWSNRTAAATKEKARSLFWDGGRYQGEQTHGLKKAYDQRLKASDIRNAEQAG